MRTETVVEADDGGPDAVVCETLSAVVAAGATQHPDRLAFVADDHALSYRQLDELASELAHELSDAGVCPGARVVLIGPNEIGWLPLYTAVDRARAVAAAVNTWVKPAELTRMLERLRPTHVLVASSAVGGEQLVKVARAALSRASTSVESMQMPLVVPGEGPGETVSTWTALSCVGSEPGRPDHADTDSVDPQEDPEQWWRDHAVRGGISVFFTSGSTGIPKAAVVRHKVGLARGTVFAARMGLPEGATVFVPVPLFWSFGGMNALFAVYSVGGTFVTASRFDPHGAREQIRSHGCRFGYFLPQLLQRLAETPAEDGRLSLDPLTGGITIGSAHDLRLARETLGISRITNAYGGTETYGHVTATAPGDDPWVVDNTQGMPLPGVDVTLELPAGTDRGASGEVGEVVVRGEVITEFVDEHGLVVSRATEVRTGDVGRFVDGRFQFVSRSHQMIRTNGINVAPKEVEDLILTDGRVADCVVVGVPHSVKGEVPVALVAVRPGWDREARLAEQIADRCSDELAGYKVPADVRLVAQIPRSVVGKVDLARARQIASAADAAIGGDS